MPIPNVSTPRRPFLTSAAHSEEVLLLESMLFCGCERALKNMIAQSNRVRSRHLHRAKLEAMLARFVLNNRALWSGIGSIGSAPTKQAR